MVIIRFLSGEMFLSIDTPNTPMTYDEIKKLFIKFIKLDSFYMLVNNDENIYTNLYDIYEMKYKKNILLLE